MRGFSIIRLDVYVRRFMSFLGRQVGLHPAHFIIAPLLFGLFLSTGLQRITYESDPEYLFFPMRSEASEDRDRLNNLFPVDYSNYKSGAESYHSMEAHLIFVPKNGSILKKHLWEVISWYDDLIFRNLSCTSFKYDGRKKAISFESVCAKFRGLCLRNDFLSLKRYMAQIESGFWNLTYPITLDPDTYVGYKLPQFAGGVDFIDDTDVVKDLSALRLSYVLDGSPEKKTDATLWLSAFNEFLENTNSSLSPFEIYRFTTLSVEAEFTRNVDSAIDFLPISVALLIAYNIWSSMSYDNPALGKPYVSLIGNFNIVLSIASAWGLLMYIGMKWISINLASLFILLGVGLDDVFVIMSSWGRTSNMLSVPDRMSLCYEEAAVSITITSLTNIASFIMGSAFPIFPSVWIFCLYSGIGILFIFIWTMTFFGGVLAISGYQEEQKRLKRDDEVIGTIIEHSYWNYIFQTALPKVLNTVSAKAVVIVFYLSYLAASTFIVIEYTKEGLDRSKLSRYDSFLSSYYEAEDKYFRTNPYRLQIVITDPLDYSNEANIRHIEDFLSALQNTSFVSKNEKFTESWIRIFNSIVNKQNNLLTGWSLTSEHEFLDKLDGTLKRVNISEIEDNVIFNPNRSQIIASRIFLQSSAVRNSFEEKLMLQEIREISKKAPFKVFVFHPYFIYFEQFLQVLPSTIYSVSITAIVVVAITFFLIPNIVFTLWVTVTLISIEIGVLASMVILDIHLDVISMICLIMCVGFSIDYSSHVSYHFVSMNIRDNSTRLKSTLAAYGPPIVQSAVSTVLSVSGLFLQPSYIVRAFSELLIIVIFLGVLHGTIILPVLLSLTFCSSSSEEKEAIRDSTLSLSVEKADCKEFISISNDERMKSGDLFVKQRTRTDSFHRSGKTRASIVPVEFLEKNSGTGLEVEGINMRMDCKSGVFLSVREESSCEEISFGNDNVFDNAVTSLTEVSDEGPEMII